MCEQHNSPLISVLDGHPAMTCWVLGTVLVLGHTNVCVHVSVIYVGK